MEPRGLFQASQGDGRGHSGISTIVICFSDCLFFSNAAQSAWNYLRSLSFVLETSLKHIWNTRHVGFESSKELNIIHTILEIDLNTNENQWVLKFIALL